MDLIELFDESDSIDVFDLFIGRQFNVFIGSESFPSAIALESEILLFFETLV